jgi:hypothetical protein
MRELFDNITISRQEDPDVAPEPKGPGKGCRYGREAAHPDEIVHLGRNKQNFQKTPS